MAGTRTASKVPAPRDVMTIDDLARYLQVPKSSLYKLAQGGRVPGHKVGKHWRFHRGAIDQWLSHSAATKKNWGRDAAHL